MPAYPMNEEPIPLPSGGVRTLIRDLGGEEDPTKPPYPYTGVIRLLRSGNKNAALWVHEGIMYSAHLDGYDPPIALRLRTARLLNDQQYAEIKDMPSEDTGPEVVDRNWIPIHIVEELHREIMLATLSHLYDWNEAVWWWEEDAVTNEYVTSGLPLMLASSAVDERIGQWKAVTRAYPNVVKPKAIPYPGPGWQNRTLTMITPEAETALAQINGINDIAQIAVNCGLTRFEIAKILSQTLAVGIITFDPNQAIAAGPLPPTAYRDLGAPAMPMARPAQMPLAPQMPIMPPSPTHMAPPDLSGSGEETPDADLASASSVSRSQPPALPKLPKLSAGPEPEAVVAEGDEEEEGESDVAAPEDDEVLAPHELDSEMDDETSDEADSEESEVEEDDGAADERDDLEDTDLENTDSEEAARETISALRDEVRSVAREMRALQSRLDEIGDRLDDIRG